MQLVATGKWSKTEKRWKMLVALRRPSEGTDAASARARRRGTATTPGQVVQLADRR